MNKRSEKRSIHVALSKETKERLSEFAIYRKKSQTSVIEYALEMLFSQEELNPIRDNIIKEAIERKFNIPKQYTVKAFWLNLFLLAHRYRNASSKKYWSEIVYLPSADKTHLEIYMELKEEIERSIKRHEEKEA